MNKVPFVLLGAGVIIGLAGAPEVGAICFALAVIGFFMFSGDRSEESEEIQEADLTPTGGWEDVVSSLVPMVMGFAMGIVGVGGMIWVYVSGESIGWKVAFTVFGLIGLWVTAVSIYGLVDVLKHGWHTDIREEIRGVRDEH